MSYNKSYPRAYRLDAHNGCLMLDKDRGYMYSYGHISEIDQPPSEAKRCEFQELPYRAWNKFRELLPNPPLSYDSLYQLPEFELIEYQGEDIAKRRVRLHKQPSYYVRGEGFKTLREAKAYVRSLPQASNQG